jgi:hypothetical protein
MTDIEEYRNECFTSAINFIENKCCEFAMFCEHVDEWFETLDVRKNVSYYEDEDELKELFQDFFSENLKDPEYGWFVFRTAYGFLEDQHKVARDVFENIEKIRYGGLLEKLDGYSDFETRHEALEFFEKSLFPYARDEREKEAFMKHFEEEMVFEPENKRIKI